MEQFSQLQKMFRRQETGGKPIVAAINGTALGGGFEICLATHYRIAAANPKTKVGQPEVKIGLLPGGGGTQRIPRLIGVQNAAPILLEGKDSHGRRRQGPGSTSTRSCRRPSCWPGQGLADGAGDRTGRAGICRQGRQGDRRPRRAAVGPQGLQVPGFPGGQVWSPPGVMTFNGGSAMVRGKTNGVYPAPKAILSCVYEGLQLPFDAALRVETRYFVSLLRDPVAKSMIRTLFFGCRKPTSWCAGPRACRSRSTRRSACWVPA